MKLQPRLVIYTVLCLLALPAGAFAATLTVNTTSDGANANCAPGSTDCSLRAAINTAGSNNDDEDTIILPAGRYQLAITGANENSGATGDLDANLVSTSGQLLTISGAGARTTTVVGTGDDRVFEVANSQLDTHISGVTFTGGTGVSQGGGIYAQGPISLTDVAITGNSATGSSGEGGGLFAQTSNTLTNVTISGNVATATDGTARGGGMYSGNGLSLTNVTISGNSAGDEDAVNGNGGEGTGLWTAASGLTTNLKNVTIAGNSITGTFTGGGGLFAGSNPNLSVVNTIVALNTTQAGATENCIGVPAGASDGHNLESGTDCGFTAAGDKQGVDPLLGPLQNNGGGTDTRGFSTGSPAYNASDNANCAATDQRGVARPQFGICDIGAFELAPDPLPPVLPPPPSKLPDPVLGKTVNVGPVSGKVFYAVPPKSASIAQIKGLKFKPLKKARQLPVRSFLNTRRGSVSLTSSRPTKGKTQNGIFSKGLFQVLQSRRKASKGITELRMKGSSFKSCKPRKRAKPAAAALSKKAIRRLRGSAKGRFRTSGRYGAATVRGTKWLTTDRCDGTLVKVTRGNVSVRDFRRKKTVLVKTGKSYLAKAPVR